MKIRTTIFAASAAAIIASCAQVAETTAINGVVVPEGLDAVNIVIKGKVDTLIPVNDGKFAVELPTDICALASASAGQYAVNFIPDGTKLAVVIDEESTVKSSSPKISVQEKFNAMTEKDKAFGEEYTAKRREILSDESMSDEERQEAYEEYYESFMETYSAYYNDLLDDNKDNILAVLALDNLRYELEDEEIVGKIAALAPELREHDYVKAMRKAVEARIETAEGKMFKDFTVETVAGTTRSIPPKPVYRTVKFSDYVGKGKYVLVDFWSPWCGPCKREMPNIKAIYEKYKGDRFDVLSIAVWERQGFEVTLNTANELGMTWNQINNAKSVPTEIYGIEGIPHIMLVGPDGTILKRGLYGEALAEAVAEYLD